jgi:serine/threonine protein kinase
VLRTLGAGTFGRVKLVRHRASGRALALKVLQKAQIVASGQTRNVLNERNVLLAVNSPFVLRLEATFQDADCLYMLLEYVQGGELFAYLAGSRLGYVPVADARFYGACVLAGLGALHERSIVYRDLKVRAQSHAHAKSRCETAAASIPRAHPPPPRPAPPPRRPAPQPENLMIDRDGFVKIVDMGFAKAVRERTYTLCGTPEYLAPELVLGAGHAAGVDLWAFGVLLFELAAGRSPFADAAGDQVAICRNIVRGRYSWPAHVRDGELRDLVARLLVRNVPARLGCRRSGLAELREHAFFAAIDWAALAARRATPPWVPPVGDGDFGAERFAAVDGSDRVEPFTGSSDWADGF